MKIIIFLITVFIPFMSYASDIIPFKVLEKFENKSKTKLTFYLQVDIIDNRLPSKKELANISNYLVSKEKPHTRTWVYFFLPDMKNKSSSDAFASAHHTPRMKVKLKKFMLYSTPYEKYLE